jgi:iron(III) transport system ATP-binding protein
MLDEPFSNLDPALRGHVRADVRRILQEAGVTAILVTHDQEEALSIADRIAVLFNGKIDQFAVPEDVYERPSTREVAAFIGDAQFLPGVAADGFVTSVLGRQPLLEPAEGDVEMLIRPEMISVAPCSDEPGAVAGTVTTRRFFGRDQQISVLLASGTEITARIPTINRFAAGEPVAITVDRPVLTFPASASSS